MILVLNVCRERLHYFEFVKPIEDILKSEGFEFESFHYKELGEDILKRADKVIICGTSLIDNSFLEDIDSFSWLKNFEGRVLGICAGFQILGLVFGGSLKKEKEIGFFRETFVEEFLGLIDEVEVYHLHGNIVEFSSDWKIFNEGEIAHAVCRGNFYGVLFHPEVRNKEMILRFAGL
jgi:GMP synthase (glutamine-hydrolysing)